MSAAGLGELRYESSTLRWFAVLAQIALWIAAIVVAFRVRVSVGRRAPLLVADETLIDLTDSALPALVDPGFGNDSFPSVAVVEVGTASDARVTDSVDPPERDPDHDPEQEDGVSP